MSNKQQIIVSSIESNDEQTSLNSFCRYNKRLQRSSSHNSRRSFTRQSNASECRNFFVKNVCNTEISPKNLDKKLNDSPQKKPRQPTPCKSKKPTQQKEQRKCKQLQRKKVELLQKDIEINEVKEKLKDKEVEIKKLSSLLRNREQLILKQQNLIQQKQGKIGKLTFQNQEAKAKIKFLEESALKNQQCISSVNNTLEKLKRSIQQNRINDIKKQNDLQKKKIGEMANQISNFTAKIEAQRKKIKDLQKQNTDLRLKLDMQVTLKAESMKQVYLEKEIERLKRELENFDIPFSNGLQHLLEREKIEQRLKSENKVLIIQLDYINRKHLEEIRLISKTKNDQIEKLKKKYKKLHQFFLQKQRQWEEKLKQRNTFTQRKHCRNPSEPTTLKSILSRVISPERSLSFELSSEKE